MHEGPGDGGPVGAGRSAAGRDPTIRRVLEAAAKVTTILFMS
jgi:hypothetical protein